MRNRTYAERLARAQRGNCYDEAEDCAERSTSGGCHNGSDTPLRCQWSCRACGFRPLLEQVYGCTDSSEGCANWAAAGECSKNPGFMRSSCGRSCDACGDRAALCARPSNSEAALAPGGIDVAMRRILRDFPQYEPRALSQ